jgi:hypothetical protein
MFRLMLMVFVVSCCYSQAPDCQDCRHTEQHRSPKITPSLNECRLVIVSGDEVVIIYQLGSSPVRVPPSSISKFRCGTGVQYRMAETPDETAYWMETGFLPAGVDAWLAVPGDGPYWFSAVAAVRKRGG